MVRLIPNFCASAFCPMFSQTCSTIKRQASGYDLPVRLRWPVDVVTSTNMKNERMRWSALKKHSKLQLAQTRLTVVFNYRLVNTLVLTLRTRGHFDWCEEFDENGIEIVCVE